jgi:hypothetical protein
MYILLAQGAVDERPSRNCIPAVEMSCSCHGHFIVPPLVVIEQPCREQQKTANNTGKH